MSTNQFRRYLDLLNEADDLVPPNTNVALPSSGTFSNDDAIANLARKMAGSAESRCAVCGTPQSQHQQLQHQFVAGNDTQPAPVAQGGGGDDNRVRQLQAELKAAGANLGATGPNRDGIDGDIGPLTRAAMAKYPDISAKYADLSGAPAAQAATPAVDTSKLIAALGKIETIIKKYKGKAKVSESQIYEADRPLSAKEYQDRIAKRIPPDAAAPLAPGAAATNPNETPEQKRIRLQKAAQASLDASRSSSAKPAELSIYDRFNKPSGAATELAKDLELTKPSWASRIGQKILSKLPSLGARTATRAGATALSGPLAPLVGIASTAYTIYDIGSMLYDAYKDSKNLEGMNDADQAVIKQNLAVVNSFMKDPKIANSLPSDIQDRVATVYKDLHELAVDTGYDTPGAGPDATKPAQAATPAPPAVAPKVKDTADQLDKLLKKNNFESRRPRTLSEQLAHDRDIVNEGLGSAAVQHVIKPVAQWGVKTFVKPIATVAGWGGVGYGGYQGYEAWKDLKAPKNMNAADKAEFDRLIADYKQMVPDQATFDALDPEVQKKLIDIANRVQQMQQQPQGTQGTQ
jgi:hypothetical protein